MDISQIPTEELLRMLAEMETPRPRHDDLEGGISPEDSLAVPAELKPVIKGTKQAVKNMKAQGLATGRVLFVADDAAFLIDPNAVQGIYGASKAESVKMAKRDLKKGGDAESILLGYPKREGISPEETIDVAVTKQGEVITGLPEMRNQKEQGNLAWGAEGIPDDIMQMALKIAQALKENNNGQEEGRREEVLA